ncbi:CrcB protein [Capnocytophaga haemolytica]|jgi:protein CrcB|uniref:Fluoride-specific ion channel FluC n=1 Tax=Capnocytophaga haemolytica TaxID=45243 RepID=A0AAX2H0X6_9FLAO|nr:fluoride efflux transporter CrcB [Capnocytophaga haemolytica]AMD85684.1 chromosome condensation protein CrcB [Capnocytophaga haemolytica]SFN90641.1 CrcB protein [Capnocytophaga haemolytica]SNV16416.1 camphor resistance protein CrcB [Capnocytophaga haemolytica]
MLKASLLVFLGSGAGGVLRMLLAGVVNLKLQKSMAFPIGIFTVNLLGCLLMGIGYAYFKQRIALSEMQILLLQGVLGGFTTFSTFSVEALQLLQEGNLLKFLIYSLGSIVLGIIMCFLGAKLVV